MSVYYTVILRLSRQHFALSRLDLVFFRSGYMYKDLLRKLGKAPLKDNDIARFQFIKNRMKNIAVIEILPDNFIADTQP
ncbi:hypothetical protein ABT56_18485 [Photobacterium aquae]|uniref:Uncharacterized protein n=1 Tax=Photobacterium aquae TaxID=1195763 RepID=A0A0J1JN18_9GAMM|nr:hypothetical protein ABT56_18485 [Photobacterium aquae]